MPRVGPRTQNSKRQISQQLQSMLMTQIEVLLQAPASDNPATAAANARAIAAIVKAFEQLHALDAQEDHIMPESDDDTYAQLRAELERRLARYVERAEQKGFSEQPDAPGTPPAAG